MSLAALGGQLAVQCGSCCGAFRFSHHNFQLSELRRMFLKIMASLSGVLFFLILFYRFLRGSCWGEPENNPFISLFHFSSPCTLVLSNYILKPKPHSCFRECSCSHAEVRLDAMLPASTPSAKATRRHCSSLGVGSSGKRVAATGREQKGS